MKDLSKLRQALQGKEDKLRDLKRTCEDREREHAKAVQRLSEGVSNTSESFEGELKECKRKMEAMQQHLYRLQDKLDSKVQVSMPTTHPP